MTDPVLLRHDDAGRCTLLLNRPERLNALDNALFEALDREFARLERQTDEIGCVILRGAGRAFCAGADLKASQAGAPATPANYKPAILERMARLPVPVLAAVHGMCLGGGLELALAADLIMADPEARFADAHGKWGYVPAWGMTQRLPRRIGYPQAKRMMFTGCEIRAAEALSMGLIDFVSQEGRLEAQADAFATAVLANSRHSNRQIKRILCATEGLSLPEGLARELYMAPGPAPDTQERLAAFRAKAARD
jgi:enoyl-CoA hydratase/carnithine racemase